MSSDSGSPAGSFVQYANAIGQMESGNNYSAIGPQLPEGDRPIGYYQVRGMNVGPWTKEVLGVALTPQQFLDNPRAQDAVFHAKFGQYLAQFGDARLAAEAWHAGPGGVGKGYKDVINGLPSRDYANRFAALVGQEPLSPVVADGSGSAPGGLSPDTLAQAQQEVNKIQKKPEEGKTVIQPPVIPDIQLQPLPQSPVIRGSTAAPSIVAARLQRTNNPSPERRSTPRNGTRRV
jgi:hypothetical protein